MKAFYNILIGNLLFLCIVIFNPFPSFSSGDWEWVYDWDGRMQGIVHVGDSTYVTVEALEDTYILVSGDAFATYDTLIYFTPTDVPFGPLRQSNPHLMKTDIHNNIYSVSSNHFAFFKTDYKTKDFTTFQVKEWTSTPIFDMYDDNIGYASGHYNYYRTYDGWKTYDSLPKVSPYLGIDKLDFINDSILEGAVYNHWEKKVFYGFLNINTNTWVEISTLNINPLHFSDLKKINNNLIFAINQEDNNKGDQRYDIIYRSRDAGLTWETQIYTDENGAPFGLQFISFHDEMNGIATGTGGRIYMTNDGGENWIYRDLPNEGLAAPSESTYGFNYSNIAWADTTPIITTLKGVIYRYTGDFFDFNPPQLEAAETISPQDKSAQPQGTVNFTWEEKGDDIEYYHLQVTTSTREWDRWLNLSANHKIENGNSFSVSGLSPDSTYYWRVLTVRGAQIRESETRSFTFSDEVAELEAPVFLSGCDISIVYSDSVRLEWTKIPGAEYYDIIATNPFSNDTILNISTQETGYTVYRDFTHTWGIQVRARGADGKTSEYSDKCEVMIAYDPPTITSDCNMGLTNEDGIISWEPPSEPNKKYFYQAVFYLDSTKENIADKIPFMSNDFITIRDLPFIKPFTNYWWEVCVRDHGTGFDLFSPFTEFCSFTTDDLGSVENIEPSELGYRLSNGTIYLENINPEASLQLHDLSGRVLISRTGNTLDVSGIARGVYLLVIDSKNVIKIQL